MKCQVPQISWHSRDPVLSIDFQPIQGDFFRLATAGTDSHVLMWYITYQDNKSIKVEYASDLYRHNKSVNAVRFSPNGQFLASGDDEGAVFIWELKERDEATMLDPLNDDENNNKEEWYPVKLLRGHLDDIYDISWSKDGNFLVSSSMDNTVIMWDMQKYTKVHIFSDFKGYVQGVSWDPLNKYIASVGSDRALRIHNVNTKKIAYNISKAPWTNSTEKGTFRARLFYDDTLQSYFRRLTFTPDGELLIVPSGILEKGDKINNTCYLFSRHALSKPVLSLPTGDKYTVAVRCNPFLYKLNGGQDSADNKENKFAKPMIDLPYRMIFAVAACDSVLLYDTEQLLPFAYVSNIHYTHLTDLSWSPDGLTLVVSSTDGYCSFVLFSREELGEIYVPEKPKEIPKEPDQVVVVNKKEKIDASEPPSVTSNDGGVKVAGAPSTPKRITPISVKSPKSGSSAKDENGPTSKVGKNPADAKKAGKKSPKMGSIKKFFISPKTVSPSPVTAKANKTPESTVKKDITPSSEKEIIEIDISDSPMKGDKKLENVDQVAKKVKGKEVESMDVEESVPIVNKAEEMLLSPTCSNAGKQSKCKVRLNFTDEDNIMANVDDNASDSNPVSCEPLMEDANPVEGIENDWRLELSQDDTSIVSVETNNAPEAETKLSSPKTFELNLQSKNGESSTSSAADPQKSSKLNQTPKRRVAFVTLSSKTSFKN